MHRRGLARLLREVMVRNNFRNVPIHSSQCQPLDVPTFSVHVVVQCVSGITLDRAPHAPHTIIDRPHDTMANTTLRLRESAIQVDWSRAGIELASGAKWLTVRALVAEPPLGPPVPIAGVPDALRTAA